MIKVTIYEENETVVNLSPENSTAAKYKQKLLEMVELERDIWCIHIYTHIVINIRTYTYIHVCASVAENFNKYDKYNKTLHLREVWASMVAQTINNLPAMQETLVWSVGQEDPLGRGRATYSSILAWRIPWTEEPGRLQSTGSQRVGHDGVTNTLREG